jgi:hypothetical protein
MEKDSLMRSQESLYRMPTAAELYALERRARDERARYFAEHLISAAHALKSLVERGLAALNAKVVGHA